MGWPAAPGKASFPNGNPMTDQNPPAPDAPTAQTQSRPVTPAAARALAEAAARRRAIDEAAAAGKAETGGRGGLDPTRYGDWEIKGLTADF